MGKGLLTKNRVGDPHNFRLYSNPAKYGKNASFHKEHCDRGKKQGASKKKKRNNKNDTINKQYIR